MWQWFLSHSIWLVMLFSFLLLLLLLLDHQKSIYLVGKKDDGRRNLFPLVFFFIRLILVLNILLLITGVIALIISEEGVANAITVTTVQQWFLNHGIIIVIILVISLLLYRFVQSMTPRLISHILEVRAKEKHDLEKQKRRSHTINIAFTGMTTAIILVVASLLILDEFGVNITPFFAGAGIVGIAIGFGAQSLIKDILQGSLIIIQDKYNHGDVVTIAGISGSVEDVNLQRTIIRDADGVVHNVPNGEISVSSNLTREKSRVNLNISVGYDEDLKHVFEVINTVGKELATDSDYGKLIITAPQVLRVDNLGDSSVDIKIMGDTYPGKQWEVTGELRRRLKNAFSNEGIPNPNQQMDIFMK